MLHPPIEDFTKARAVHYATTIHTAQGVTADTTHSLVDELMTREQLYTTISRGRTANHIYVAVGGDGNPHSILRADLGESAASDLLQRVLSRSSLAASATTIRRQQQTAADLRRRLHTPRPSHSQSYGPEPVVRGPAAHGR
jgi:ATP-dependent exoDNAse (exonuclease V) alpha subunit